MKKANLILFMLSLFFTIVCNAQTTDAKDVKTAITGFVKAGDKNDARKLENYLDDNYRIVMNRLFGNESVNIMDRATYLAKIESKEFGGDNRKVSIENVVINGKTASAKVTMMGEKATFISIMVLVQDNESRWKLVSDVPTVE